MSYKLSEKNWQYGCLILGEDNTVLIGVPQHLISVLRKLQSEESVQIIDNIVLSADCPCEMFVNLDASYKIKGAGQNGEETSEEKGYHERLFSLSSESRRVISGLVNELKKDGTISRHIGANFAAVLNFLIARYQKSLKGVITEKPLNDIFINQKLDVADQVSSALTAIDKLKETASPIKENQRKLNFLCASHLITPSVIYTGTGTLFTLKRPSYATDEQMQHFYDEYINKVADAIGIHKSRKYKDDQSDLGKNIDIKKLLLESSIISEKDIGEQPIKVFTTYWNVPNREAKIIRYLLKELK